MAHDFLAMCVVKLMRLLLVPRKAFWIKSSLDWKNRVCFFVELWHSLIQLSYFILGFCGLRWKISNKVPTFNNVSWENHKISLFLYIHKVSLQILSRFLTRTQMYFFYSYGSLRPSINSFWHQVIWKHSAFDLINISCLLLSHNSIQFTLSFSGFFFKKVGWRRKTLGFATSITETTASWWSNVFVSWNRVESSWQCLDSLRFVSEAVVNFSNQIAQQRCEFPRRNIEPKSNPLGRQLILIFSSHRHMAGVWIDNKMGHHTWNEGQFAVGRLFRLMSLKFFSIFCCIFGNFGFNKLSKGWSSLRHFIILHFQYRPLPTSK